MTAKKIAAIWNYERRCCCRVSTRATPYFGSTPKMGCTIRRATWAARNMYHNSWRTHHPWNTKHAIRTPLLDNTQFQRRSMTIFLCARSFFFSARGSFLSRCYSSLPLVSFTSITKQMIHMIRQSPLRDGDREGGGKIMIVKTQDLSTLNFCDYRFFAYFRFSSCYRIPESELTYFIFFFSGFSAQATRSLTTKFRIFLWFTRPWFARARIHLVFGYENRPKPLALARN